MNSTAAFALVWLIFSVSARAENDGRSDDSKQEPGPLAAAKESFDRLKTPQISTGTQIEIASLPAPDFGMVPTGPIAHPSVQPKPASEARSPWLVQDVLDKGVSGENRENSRDGADAAGLNGVSDLATATKTSPFSVGEKPVLLGLKGASNNPLDAYLAGWISPQDRRLVRTNTEAPAASAVGVDSAAQNMAGPLSEYHGSTVSTDRKDFRPGNAKNPYLQVPASMPENHLPASHPLSGKPAAATGNNAFTAGGGLVSKNSPGPISNFRNSADDADPRPDLQRASEQQKYFRQLKRF